MIFMLLQLNAGICTRIEWCLVNQANVKADYHCLPLQKKLDAAWSLFALQSIQKKGMPAAPVIEIPFFHCVFTLGSVDHCSLHSKPALSAAEDTAGLIGDSYPHSQKAALPQGCGQAQERTTTPTQNHTKQSISSRLQNLLIFCWK